MEFCCYSMIYACVFLVASHFPPRSPLFLRLQLSMALQWPLTLSKLRSASNPGARNSSPMRRQKTQTATVLRNAAKCGTRAHSCARSRQPSPRGIKSRALDSLFSLLFIFERVARGVFGRDPIPLAHTGAQKMLKNAGLFDLLPLLCEQSAAKEEEGGERQSHHHHNILLIRFATPILSFSARPGPKSQ